MAKAPLGVRNYRSSVKGRKPAVADMAYGDLAINYNHEDPALIIKGDDNALIEFKPGSGVTVGAAAPATAKDGDLWWDTTSARLFVRFTSGSPAVSTWVDASPAAVPPALANALVYKGTVDPTVARAVGAAPAVGDTYVASKAGTADASWTGLGGQAVSLHELLVWDGTNWDGAGTAASPRTAWQGKVDITAAKPSGYVAQVGDLVEVSNVGVLHADWTTMPAGVAVGSVLIYDGAGWVLLNEKANGFKPNWIARLDLTKAIADVKAGYTPAIGDVVEAVHNGSAHADWVGLRDIIAGSSYVFDGAQWRLLTAGVAINQSSASEGAVYQLVSEVPTFANLNHPVQIGDRFYRPTTWDVFEFKTPNAGTFDAMAHDVQVTYSGQPEAQAIATLVSLGGIQIVRGAEPTHRAEFIPSMFLFHDSVKAEVKTSSTYADFRQGQIVEIKHDQVKTGALRNQLASKSMFSNIRGPGLYYWVGTQFLPLGDLDEHCRGYCDASADPSASDYLSIDPNEPGRPYARQSGNFAFFSPTNADANGLTSQHVITNAHADWERFQHFPHTLVAELPYISIYAKRGGSKWVPLATAINYLPVLP
jgi:hypothetical protein